MKYEIKDRPDFGVIEVRFDNAGEKMLVESSAMVARDSAMTMSTNMQGGLLAAAKRKLLTGESLFQNTFTATAPGQSLWIAPGPEGDVSVLEMDGAHEVLLNSGAFLACGEEVNIDSKWGGAKSFFSGTSFFLIKASGHGPLFFNAYGGLHAVDVGPGGYVVDNNHVVGFTSGLQYEITKVGGMKSFFFGGEGLVCRFHGQGRLWLSTRNPGSLANFVHPYRIVQRNNG